MQDFATHERAIALVRIQQRLQLNINTSPHIRGHKGMAQVRSAEVIQVHCQERHVRGYIRAAESRVEFDAIEQIEASARRAHTTGVQIAVAIANVSVVNAPLKQIPV
jgi:hypothetical protein